MVAVGDPQIIDVPADTANIPAGLRGALRADGRAAFVYARKGTGTVDCHDLSGAVVGTADLYEVVVDDEQADGTYRERVADANVPIQFGDSLDISVDPGSDSIVVAYQGGTTGVASCTSSDMLVAVENGAGFTTTTIARDSSDGSGPCRTAQNVCANGDVVGRFPALAHNGDGSVWALSYVDEHQAQGVDDITGADLEVCINATGPDAYGLIQTVSGDAGAGYQGGAAITPDGRVFVGQDTLASNHLSDPNGGPSFDLEEGIRMDTQQTDGTWVETLVFPRGSVTTGVSVAANDTGLWAVFKEDGTKQLILVHSVDDGATFTTEIPERLSITGSYPSIGFLSDGTLVLAYGHCNDDTHAAGCDPKQDGVRVTWRTDPLATTFSSHTFKGDDEDSDGTRTDMAIDADDNIVLFSYNPTQSQVFVQRVKKQVKP